MDPPEGIRLQKALANAGVASRRVIEQYIVEGRIRVNGRTATELGTRIDPETDLIDVDGTAIQLDVSKRYVMLNKPTGVVSTMKDENGRPDLRRFTKDWPERLYNVGRLDAETSGLLILTNDGDLAHRLQHPAHGVLKTYIAEIPGPVPKDLGKRLREGVQLEDGPVAVDSFRVVDSRPGKAIVEVILHEGRKHIVRRMLEHVGHPVLSLVRTQVGPITLGTTKSGRWRALSRAEIADLYKAAGL
jgi:23S rRNA pseudouridine2605 synthase